MMEREQTTIRLPKELKEKLEREAQEMKITIDDMLRCHFLVNEAIHQIVKQPRKTKEHVLNINDLPIHSSFIGDFDSFFDYMNRRGRG